MRRSCVPASGLVLSCDGVCYGMVWHTLDYSTRGSCVPVSGLVLSCDGVWYGIVWYGTQVRGRTALYLENAALYHSSACCVAGAVT